MGRRVRDIGCGEGNTKIVRVVREIHRSGLDKIKYDCIYIAKIENCIGEEPPGVAAIDAANVRIPTNVREL